MSNDRWSGVYHPSGLSQKTRGKMKPFKKRRGLYFNLKSHSFSVWRTAVSVSTVVAARTSTQSRPCSPRGCCSAAVFRVRDAARFPRARTVAKRDRSRSDIPVALATGPAHRIAIGFARLRFPSRPGNRCTDCFFFFFPFKP